MLVSFVEHKAGLLPVNPQRWFDMQRAYWTAVLHGLDSYRMTQMFEIMLSHYVR